jgi:hypothetical protein
MNSTTSAQKPNYYLLLNVPKTVDEPELRAAYYRASLSNHPDKHGGNTAKVCRPLPLASVVLNDPCFVPFFIFFSLS